MSDVYAVTGSQLNGDLKLIPKKNYRALMYYGEVIAPGHVLNYWLSNYPDEILTIWKDTQE